jgi:hypothetical protein
MEMNEFFLVASPRINPRKDTSHRIESVLFVATNGFASRRWVVENIGGLALDIACLVVTGATAHVIRKLCEGETYLFDETFTLEEIEAWMQQRGKSL